MAFLRFAIPGNNAATRTHPALPVNVHRARDNAVVKRMVTGKDADLAPGDYVAVVLLPDGTEAAHPFNLGNTSSGEVQLAEVADVISEAVELKLSGETNWTSDLSCRLVAFNPFSDVVDVEGGQREFKALQALSGPHDDRLRYLAIAPRREGKASPGVFLIATPIADALSLEVAIEFDSDGYPRPMFRMERTASTLLYRYLEQGGGEPALRMSESVEMTAQDLVDNKSEDPVSAALAMYLLIAGGRFSMLGERAEKLHRYNQGLGDGAIIYAEYLALSGNHEKAIETLLSIAERSTPVLTAGFRMALARIATYQQSDYKNEKLSRIDTILRYWGRRCRRGLPTAVLKLDGQWTQKILGALA